MLDDARALSLFASERLILVRNAEAVLPKGKVAEEPTRTTRRRRRQAALLAAYLKDPTPGVVLVFEAIRFDFEGEDKAKQDRVRKFYAAIPDTVELRRYSVEDAAPRRDRWPSRRLRHRSDALELLVEALGADIARVAVEIEKLALYAGPGRTIRRTISPRWCPTRAPPRSSRW